MSDESIGREGSGYFFTDPSAQIDPSAEPRFLSVDRDVLGLHPVKESPGLTLRPVFGQNLTMSFVYMEPGTVAPVRSPVPAKIHELPSAICSGACWTLGSRKPLYASPTKGSSGQLAGGFAHVLPVTARGSPWPLSGSAAESR